MIKRIVFFALSLVFCLGLLSGVPTQAIKFGDIANVPKDFWPIVTPYEKALETGDLKAIASSGEAIINYWLKGGTAEQRAAEWTADAANHGFEINYIWVVSRNVALTYEKLADYTNAVRLFKVAIAFVNPYKALITSGIIDGNVDDMEFSRLGMQSKIEAYEIEVELYAEIEKSVGVGDKSYIGAKNEPQTGIYFGTTAGASPIKEFDKKHSSITIYVDYETEDMEGRVITDLQDNEKLYGYSRNDYSVIQIAWNFLNEGSSLKSIPNDSAKITKAAQFLKSFGEPVLLRVGAEMNVWQNAANPAEYIAAFRFIADIMHKNAPNVAIVWSVNYVSAAGLTYDMFYPGASYVDWVGISLYTRRYSSGDPNTTDDNAAIWSTGKFANPVKFVENLVKQYGSKHPIVISENGVTLWNNSNNEDLTDWAIPRIRQTYTYIPMLFPQVKAIYWFNRAMPKEAVRFDFSVSPKAQTVYQQLTASGYFLGKGQTTPDITFKKLGTVTLPANKVTLLTYAPYFAFDSVTVQYKLNGELIAQSAEIPYRQSLNLASKADGEYKLSILVLQNGDAINSKDYNLLKHGANVTISTGRIDPPPSTGLPFTDVPAGAWYFENVANAYKAGLMTGKSSTTFVPLGPVTIAEAITMAARAHAGGDDKIPAAAGSWYVKYVNYAIANGIIKQGELTRYNSEATRAEMAYIFANVIPENKKTGTISLRPPDVKAGDPYAEEIFLLYSMGVLTGNDSSGAFTPNNNINRASAATILLRIDAILNS